MIADAAQLLAANALLLLAGVGVLRLAGWRGSERSPAGLGLAYLAGVAAVGVLAQLLLLAGRPLVRTEIVALCGALFVAGLVTRLPAKHEKRPRTDVFTLVGAALVAVFFVVLAVNLWSQPLFGWDAWQHWTPKARSFVLLDGLQADLFAVAPWNPDYPVLLPALEAIDFRFMGFNTRILHLQFGLLLAGFVLSFVRLARPAVPTALLWPSLVAIVWAPALAIQTASAYADVPLAIFFALAGMFAWRWLADGDRRDLVLLALFSAAALATKMEGLVYIGALFFVATILAGRQSRGKAGAILLAGGAALVGIVPWRIWTLQHGIEGVYSSGTFLGNATDPGFLAEHVGRIPLVLGTLVFELLDPRSWLLLVPMALVATGLALRHSPRRDGAVLLLGTVAVALAGLLAIYVLSPFDVSWHLDRSAWRVVTGLVLFSAVLMPLLLAQALQRAERETSAPKVPAAAMPVRYRGGLRRRGNVPA